MGLKTKISWANHSWNPWQGCKRVSEGCRYCYMFREKKRYGQDPENIYRSANSTFYAPLNTRRWESEAKVFVCSWSDFFIEHEDADKWRRDALEIINKRSDITFIILTKRPENAIRMMRSINIRRYPSNIWMGVSIENRNTFNRALTLNNFLLETGQEDLTTFISFEPLLEKMSTHELDFAVEWFDWIITGGESCSPRRSKIEWFREIRDVCKLNNVPYLHKQNGGTIKHTDGEWGGAAYDGKYYMDFPI